MTLAVLVIGYREPEVLGKVLQFYLEVGADIYLHVDQKMSAADYLRRLGAYADQVNLVEQRLNIFWAGFSMIRATMSLLETALEQKQYSNYLLVSDDTVPAVTVTSFCIHMTANRDRIGLRRLAEDDVFFDRYKGFFYLDHAATSLLGRPIETSNIDEDFIVTMARLQHRRRIGKPKIPIYYGSQWWCLTAETIDLIITKFRDSADIREAFEFSAVPDECYFQTLVGNFASSVPSRLSDGPVFVDWTQQPRPFVFSDISQMPQLELGRHFLIRKATKNALHFVEQLLAKNQR